MSQIVKFGVCVGGIYASYITQGYVSEALSKREYGADRERFPHLQSLVFFQCVACFVWSAILWLLIDSRKSGDAPAFWKYWMPALTNVIGPSCGMQALRNITYPAQVLAKSSKMVPIMFAGVLVSGKHYRFSEYMSALAISLGVGFFAIFSSRKAASALQDANAGLGYTLVAVNLALDAFTNAKQDHMNMQYKHITPLHMRCWTNFWGALFHGTYMFGFSSNGMEVVRFALKHDAMKLDLLLFCVCGAMGQLFIFWTIKQFGSLVTSIVCTTRKFFSILLSVLVSGTALTVPQWLAVALVFAGLLYKSLVKAAAPKHKAV
jgi:UDP-galactose transporter B1